METPLLTHLTSIHSAIGVSCADEVLVDRLEVTAVAILIPPNGQFRLSLAGGLLTTVVGGAPAHNGGSTSGKPFLGRHPDSLWQADRDYIL